jgi:hypothetical protein
MPSGLPRVEQRLEQLVGLVAGQQAAAVDDPI